VSDANFVTPGNYSGTVGQTGDGTLQMDGSGRCTVDPDYIALDTDGRVPPTFRDDTRQTQTSYAPGGVSMDATTEHYVVVPEGSPIKNGTQVTVTDRTSGVSANAIVGDRGPGYGEISLALARTLGAWREGMGDAILQHDIVFQFSKCN